MTSTQMLELVESALTSKYRVGAIIEVSRGIINVYSFDILNEEGESEGAAIAILTGDRDRVLVFQFSNEIVI